MPVIIPEDIFARVFKVMGYPIVKIEDFEDTMTMEQFKELVLKDALQEYFSWFPKKEVQEVVVGRQFELDFPDESTYGIVDYRVVLTQNAVSGRTGNVFLDAVSTTMNQGTVGGAFGTKYNYDMHIAREWDRLARQAQVDRNRYAKVSVDQENRKITGYSSFPGKLNITWAKMSENFNDVLFEHRQDAIELMQAETLLFFGRVWSKLAEASPINFDYDNALEEGKELKEKIIEKWRSKPRIVVLRS